MTKRYTINDLCQFIDHTNLKPYVSTEEIKDLCMEAKEYNFKMVAVNQVQSNLCSKLLEDSDVAVGAAIAFPLGQTSIESKVFETQNAINNGATEIDYVINITEVKNENYQYIEEEMRKIVEVCNNAKIPSKVIFENCYLTESEKIKLCEIAKVVKPTFIKTSTGFGDGGATVEDVKLMKKHVGDKVKVKAAGGIRDVETFISMIRNGAERIGCSSGIPIIEAIKKELSSTGVDYIEI